MTLMKLKEGFSARHILLCTMFILISAIVLTVSLPAHAGEEENLGLLDNWRKINENARESTQVQNPPERIKQCEAFLKEYPDFEDPEPILQALVDAYIDSGSFDPAHVSSLIEQIAVLDEENYYTPIDLVERYHLKYSLPLESALRLLNLSRERFPKGKKSW